MAPRMAPRTVPRMPTMKDVAARAGVSIATVSFLLNDTKPVAPATRARIEQAMSELGFRRNMVARALASRRTRMLALAYPAIEHATNFSTSVGFLAGAAMRAGERSYHLVIWPVGYDGTDLTELVGQGLVDGVLLMEVQLDDRRIDTLQAAGVPAALIGRNAEPDGIPHVDFDFVTTVDQALEHLQQLGHRDIALVIGSQEVPTFRRYGAYVRTEDAFTAAVGRRGLIGNIHRCESTAAAGARAMVEISAGAATAVMVMNTGAIGGLATEASRRGLQIPGDLSLIGLFVGDDVSELYDPPLTILRSPATELGRLGVDALISTVEGDGMTAPTLLPGTLRPGGSTGPARR